MGGKEIPEVLQGRFANQVNTSRYQPLPTQRRLCSLSHCICNAPPPAVDDFLNKRGPPQGKWTRADTARISKVTWASHETIVDNLPNAVPNSASAAAEEYLSILQDMVVKMRLK